MSLILIGLFVVFFTLTLAQFGSKLAAQNSLVWWALFGFLIFVMITPTSLEPLAHLLGIQTVSNMILGGLSVFLMIQLIQESISNTRAHRKLREVVCNGAARQIKNSPLYERFHRPMASTAQFRALVVFPTYNEEECLPNVLQTLARLPIHPDYELIPLFVNDASADRTEQLLAEQSHALWVTHDSNMGVSGALLTGFKVAAALNCDLAIQCDSDGQHPLAEIDRLVRMAQTAQTDLLIGSRYVGKKLAEDRGFSHQSSTHLRRFGGILIFWSLGLFGSRAQVTDPTSGFRVYSRRAIRFLQRLMPDEYPEPEVVALLSLQKMNVKETRVEMVSRQGGKSSISGLKNGLFMLKVMTALLGLRLRTIR